VDTHHALVFGFGQVRQVFGLHGDADNPAVGHTGDSGRDMILPAKRNDSRIRTHPKMVMRMRQPSMLHWSLVSVKRSSFPFLRNCGYLARPAKKFLNASPNWMIAICGAFLVTSSIHGNFSRLMAFN